MLRSLSVLHRFIDYARTIIFDQIFGLVLVDQPAFAHGTIADLGCCRRVRKICWFRTTTDTKSEPPKSLAANLSSFESLC